MCFSSSTWSLLVQIVGRMFNNQQSSGGRNHARRNHQKTLDTGCKALRDSKGIADPVFPETGCTDHLNGIEGEKMNLKLDTKTKVNPFQLRKSMRDSGYRFHQAANWISRDGKYILHIQRSTDGTFATLRRA